MSDFEDLTGPAALGEDDADTVAHLSIEEDDEEAPIVDDSIEEADPLLEEDDEEDEEEDEDDDAKEIQERMWDAMYGDRE